MSCSGGGWCAWLPAWLLGRWVCSTQLRWLLVCLPWLSLGMAHCRECASAEGNVCCKRDAGKGSGAMPSCASPATWPPVAGSSELSGAAVARLIVGDGEMRDRKEDVESEAAGSEDECLLRCCYR